MYNSTNMRLRVWNDLDDPYSKDDLVYNWERVDDHDHTDQLGLQIPEGGIANNAISLVKMQDNSVGTAEIVNGSVTTTELADNSVTSAKIVDGTIQGADIGNGQVGLGHLSQAAVSAIAPLGMCIAWYRPTTGTPVPDGWQIATGQTIAAAQNGWGVDVTLPDMRNKFILGAATTGTGTGPTTPPAEKDGGGSNNRSLAHTHTVNGHSHVVDAHSHVVNAHAHTVPNHAHGIGGDGAHNHGMRSRQARTLANPSPTGNDSLLQTVYIAGFNSGGGDAGVPGIDAHSHGGATAGSGAFGTDAQAPGTSNAAPGTSSVGLTTNSTDPGGDSRPLFVGLLFIIKVKNPTA